MHNPLDLSVNHDETMAVTDRRIPRTKALLQHALISLILKNDYEAITIQNICDAANVSRSAFYAHFKNKDDLKRSGFEHLRKQLADRQKEARADGDVKGRFLSFSLTMFEHAHDHKDLYRALVGGRGAAVSLAFIRGLLSDLVRNEFPAHKNSADVPRELAVQYVVGAYMAVLIWWLDGGAKLPPNRMDAMFQQLAISGIMPR